MFWIGSLPRKWSMRKMRSSGRWRCRIVFSSRAEAWSRPKGFSTITLASWMQPPLASPSVTVANMLGGGGRGEHARRDGQVVQGPLGVAQGLAELLEGLGVGVVAVDVAQQPRQLGERLLVDLAVVLEAVVGPPAQLFQVPTRPGHADDGHVQAAALDQCLEGGEDLLVGEVAGGTEEHDGVGTHAVDRTAPWSRCRLP